MTVAEKQQDTYLPLVRLSLILPFVEELDRRRINTDEVLVQSGLARQTVTDLSVFVPAIVIYRFVENAARAASDPQLGVHVGENLDLSGWPPLIVAVAHSNLLIDFLARFMEAAKDEASSVRYSLEVTQEHALFKQNRIKPPDIVPAQVDAFTATYTLNLIRRGAGRNWNPGSVAITVCDPDALPDRYQGVTVVGGDRQGVVVRFPAEWLLHTLDRERLIKSITPERQRAKMPRDFIAVLRSMLALHLAKPELNVDFVAQLFGISRQSLQRKLKAGGTTLLKEIAALKKERACGDLATTNKSISEIATSLGFSSAVSFTRAFKSWMNQSPSDYRKSHKYKGG
jgi:AraC-like DNA-binding protein